jgi:hypothetical protein
MAPETDIAERMVRVETKLDFLIGQIDKLPPSPVCLVKHKEIDDRHEMLVEKVEKVEQKFSGLERWQNRVIGAVVAANIVLILAMEKIRLFFFGGPSHP